VRPSISEQLAGLRRIIAEVIAPEVTGAYPEDMLRGVLANLEMLETSWSRVGPFLAWDNEGTERLLEAIAALMDPTLVQRIEATLVAAPHHPSDVDALDAHNTALRDVLADAVPVLAAGGDRTHDVYRAVRMHLRERMDRFPLVMNAPMPGAPR
jgi:hypothetical protein